MDLTVITGTFGDFSWQHLARTRTWPSVVQEKLPWRHVHGDTLAKARNAALAKVETEWVCCVDADDELEPGYAEAMARGTADVRGPMALYVHGARERLWHPRVAGHHHTCSADCLPEGNWLLVGSVVRTELLRRAGGWRDFDWSEDWDTWLRCRAAGATFELIEDAIYRAHFDPHSRNRGASQAVKAACHEQIHRANFPEQYADAA